MRRSRTVVISLLVFIVAAIAQVKTPDLNLTGAGARAEGFGGAFIGLADDATAVVWNPAGLSQLEKPEASVVMRLVGESTDFTNDDDPLFNAKESQSVFGLNFGSVALPLSFGETKIVAAIAFQQQLDFSEKRRREFEIVNLFKLRQGIDVQGGVNTITPAVAARISPAFSVGLSVNIWTGSIERKEEVRLITSSQDTKDIEEIKTDYSGFNFVIGGLIDFESMKSGIPLKIGASFKTPFTLTSSGEYELLSESDPTTSGKVDIEQEIEMPIMLGLGTSYRIGENFTLAFDYEFRNFAKKNITTTVKNGGGSFSSLLSESGKNLDQFRIGAEYLMVFDEHVIPIRLGVKTVPTVITDYEYDAIAQDFVPTANQVSGSGISFGTGYITDAFAFDLTYSSTSYTQKYGNAEKIEYATGTISASVIMYF